MNPFALANPGELVLLLYGTWIAAAVYFAFAGGAAVGMSLASWGNRLAERRLLNGATFCVGEGACR